MKQVYRNVEKCSVSVYCIETRCVFVPLLQGRNSDENQNSGRNFFNDIRDFGRTKNDILDDDISTGLPLGPLNPLKSLFKHLVPNVTKSQKWSLKSLFLCNWLFFNLSVILTKFRVYILTKNVLGLLVKQKTD